MTSPTASAVMEALAAAGFTRAVSQPSAQATSGYAVIPNRPGDGIVLVSWHDIGDPPDPAVNGFMLGSYHGILMRDYDVQPGNQSAEGPGWLVVSAKGASSPAAAGPFETAAEASAHPAVGAIYAAMNESSRRGAGQRMCHRLLDEACTAAGVELGAYDHRVIQWLAGWDPQTCIVVAGLIERAAAARGGEEGSAGG